MSSHWLLCCIVCHEKSAVNLLAFPHTWWVMFLLLLLRFSHFLCLSAFCYIFRYGSVCFYSIWGSSCFWKYRSMLFFKFQAFSHYFAKYFFCPTFFLLSCDSDDMHVASFVTVPTLPECLLTYFSHLFSLCSLDWILPIVSSSSSPVLSCYFHSLTEPIKF